LPQALANSVLAISGSLLSVLHGSAAGQAAAAQAHIAWNATASVLLHNFTMAPAHAPGCCPVFLF